MYCSASSSIGKRNPGWVFLSCHLSSLTADAACVMGLVSRVGHVLSKRARAQLRQSSITVEGVWSCDLSRWVAKFIMDASNSSRCASSASCALVRAGPKGQGSPGGSWFGSWELLSRLSLFDRPPSSSSHTCSSHVRAPLSLSLSFVPFHSIPSHRSAARVLRVHPSRDSPRREEVPGPAQESLPY